MIRLSVFIRPLIKWLPQQDVSALLTLTYKIFLSRTEKGREIRALFYPGAGYDTLVSADYSQIELRILAHLSGDEALIKAFVDGKDIHRFTAAEVLGKSQEDVTSEERSHAKAINFGIIYGISDFGLSRDLGITRGGS